MDEDLDALFETDSLDESVDDDASADDSIDASPDASADDSSHEDLTAHSSEEPEEDRVVLGGPVTDAFSALVLAMRAKGHGETTTADAGAGGPGEITSYSSFANPTPWSTFDKMHAGEVKNCLGGREKDVEGVRRARRARGRAQRTSDGRGGRGVARDARSRFA
jgi:hypothetical protein